MTTTAAPPITTRVRLSTLEAISQLAYVASKDPTQQLLGHILFTNRGAAATNGVAYAELLYPTSTGEIVDDFQVLVDPAWLRAAVAYLKRAANPDTDPSLEVTATGTQILIAADASQSSMFPEDEDGTDRLIHDILIDDRFPAMPLDTIPKKRSTDPVLINPSQMTNVLRAVGDHALTVTNNGRNRPVLFRAEWDYHTFTALLMTMRDV
jgi:hypothetical protein